MVEAMGHINYDLSMQEDHKGIIKFKSKLNPGLELHWTMYTFPLHTTHFFSWKETSQALLNKPVLLKATIEISNPADTYLNMKKYTKGYIWANGINLGRFWNVGPQFKLYCPGVWLKNGTNEIYVLDLKYAG